MSTITLSKSDASGVKSDVLVIGVVKLDGGVALPAGTESLNAAYGGKLVEVLSGLGATGKTGEVTKVPGPKPGKSATLIAVGLGTAPDGALKTEDLRTAAGVGVRAAMTGQSVAFALPTPDAECVRAVAEGALIGRYTFNAYKSEASTEAPGNLTVLTDLARSKEAKAALERAEIVADAVHQVRDWVNTPRRTCTRPSSPSMPRSWARSTASRSRCWTRRRSPRAGTAASSASARDPPTRRGWSGSATHRRSR